MSRSVELTPMRRAVARRMVASKREAPHFYVSAELELDRALAHLRALNEAPEATRRVSLTALLVRACRIALEEHRQLNALWEDDGLLLADEVNMGVAIALDQGLVAPAILERDSRDLVATAVALDDLVERARAGRLRGTEMTGATFTLTNLGMFEVSSFIPIVTPPQVAILATGKVTRKPRFDGGRLVERSILCATVSADHRALDGADVARFLGTFKHAIEHTEVIDG